MVEKEINSSKINRYRPAIKRLRIILMFLMCIYLFGFPKEYGTYIQTACGFVPIAFFIISGYLILREGEDRPKRIVRAIIRTAIVFVALVAVYFTINYFFYRVQGIDVTAVFKSKRFWFNFIVLNVWPFNIGSVIWYVQATLYAYIIIYFLDRWDLLRYDWIISASLILFTFLTGELAGLIRWNVLGYTYIPGNFFTRAIPYILLGCFAHRKKEIFRKISRLWYCAGAIVGFILVFAEIYVFAQLGIPGYYGHLLGYGVAAFFICMVAFQDPYNEEGFEKKLDMSRWHVNLIYYICQPVSVAIVWGFLLIDEEIAAEFVGVIGILTFAVCFGIAWLVSLIWKSILRLLGFVKSKIHGQKD